MTLRQTPCSRDTSIRWANWLWVDDANAMDTPADAPMIKWAKYEEVDSDLEDFYDLVHLRLQAQHDGLRMRAVQAFSLRSAMGPGHVQIGQLLRR